MSSQRSDVILYNDGPERQNSARVKEDRQREAAILVRRIMALMRRRSYSREYRELITQSLWRVQPSTLGHAETHTWPCCGHWYGRRTILSRYKFAGEDIRRWEVREPLWEHGGEEYTRQGEPVRRRWGDS